MNASKAKGSRRERQARKLLEAAGYATTRAAGSLGAFDLVGVRRESADGAYIPVVRLVQVKSNRWPRTPESELLTAEAAQFNPTFVSVEIWRFDDGNTEPKIRRLSDDAGNVREAEH
jgi:hypothetical protein